jgi:hypothetical protein
MLAHQPLDSAAATCTPSRRRCPHTTIPGAGGPVRPPRSNRQNFGDRHVPQRAFRRQLNQVRPLSAGVALPRDETRGTLNTSIVRSKLRALALELTDLACRLGSQPRRLARVHFGLTHPLVQRLRTRPSRGDTGLMAATPTVVPHMLLTRRTAFALVSSNLLASRNPCQLGKRARNPRDVSISIFIIRLCSLCSSRSILLNYPSASKHVLYLGQIIP